MSLPPPIYNSRPCGPRATDPANVAGEARGTVAPDPGSGGRLYDQIEQTCTGCPAQWDITLDDGRRLYVRYRWDSLTVNEYAADRIGEELYRHDGVTGDPHQGWMTTDEMLALLEPTGVLA